MRVELAAKPSPVASPVAGDRADLTPAERARRAARPLALVTMPFVSALRPSLQVGMLKPVAESYGFPTETLHLNLDFAVQIGVEAYEALCQHRGPMVGDWLFSVAAFGSEAPDPHAHLLDELGPELEAGLGEAGLGRSGLRELR